MNDPFNLMRFVAAQDLIYDEVVKELLQGQKQQHWMWYIFPQIKGLGLSPMAQRYAITSEGEAKAYLAHAVLGTRLNACTQLVLDIEGRPVEQIFSYPDDLKFRSCMTLFASVAKDREIFTTVLTKYFAGEPDQATQKILARVTEAYRFI